MATSCLRAAVETHPLTVHDGRQLAARLAAVHGRLAGGRGYRCAAARRRSDRHARRNRRDGCRATHDAPRSLDWRSHNRNVGCRREPVAVKRKRRQTGCLAVMRPVPRGIQHHDIPAYVAETHQHRCATVGTEGCRAVGRRPPSHDASLEDFLHLLRRAECRLLRLSPWRGLARWLGSLCANGPRDSFRRRKWLCGLRAFGAGRRDLPGLRRLECLSLHAEMQALRPRIEHDHCAACRPRLDDRLFARDTWERRGGCDPSRHAWAHSCTSGSTAAAEVAVASCSATHSARRTSAPGQFRRCLNNSASFTGTRHSGHFAHSSPERFSAVRFARFRVTAFPSWLFDTVTTGYPQ